jgi:hypothetical protein
LPECRPGEAVVGLAVAAVEGGEIDDLFLAGLPGRVSSVRVWMIRVSKCSLDPIYS